MRPLSALGLRKEIDKLNKDLARVDAKLVNAGFIAKAPPAVVAKEREKGAALRSQREVLNAQLNRLEAA